MKKTKLCIALTSLTTFYTYSAEKVLSDLGISELGFSPLYEALGESVFEAHLAHLAKELVIMHRKNDGASASAECYYANHIRVHVWANKYKNGNFQAGIQTFGRRGYQSYCSRTLNSPTPQKDFQYLESLYNKQQQKLQAATAPVAAVETPLEKK